MWNNNEWTIPLKGLLGIGDFIALVYHWKQFQLDWMLHKLSIVFCQSCIHDEGYCAAWLNCFWILHLDKGIELEGRIASAIGDGLKQCGCSLCQANVAFIHCSAMIWCWAVTEYAPYLLSVPFTFCSTVSPQSSMENMVTQVILVGIK